MQKRPVSRWMRLSASRAEIFAASVLVGAAAVVMSGWLLAAPPGASPDDSYHLASIWCAEGFKDDVCVEDPGAPDLSRVFIPFSAAQLVCFQHDGAKSAACAIEEQQSQIPVLTPVVGSNIRRERPNLYYLAMHQLIGQNLMSSLNRMRAANILVVLAMFSLTALVADPRVRRAFLLSAAVTSVPLGLFLMGSLNTSAWGLAGLASLWANSWTALSHSRRSRRFTATTLAIVGLMLALGARTEAVAHAVFILVALLTLWWGTSSNALRYRRLGKDPDSVRERNAVTVASVGVALAAIIALAPRSAGLDNLAKNLTSGYSRLAARDIGNPFLTLSFEIPSLWTGGLGGLELWGLGALDTPIPSVATLSITGIYVVLLTLGLQGAARPRARVSLFLGGMLFLFPMFALLQAGALVYEGLQPRQFMPLLYVTLGVALLRVPEEADLTLGPGVRRLAVVLLSAAHSVALLVTMRRHTSGLAELRYVSFNSPLEWWWDSAPEPNLVWLVTSVAFVVVISRIVGMLRPDRASRSGFGH